MEDTGEEIKGILDYDAEKFEAVTARQIACHFVALLEAAADEPDAPIDALSMLGAEELAQVEMHGLDTSDRLPLWPCSATALRAQERRDSLAPSDTHRQLTFGELDAHAGVVAAYLRGRGIGPGRTVALMLPAGPDLAVAQLGVMKAGRRICPDRSGVSHRSCGIYRSRQ